jgi:hypothetical protein
MKTLSVKQPWAHLICSGLKDIENRKWPTKYRGRVLIHASAKAVKYDDPKLFFTPDQYSQIIKETEFVSLAKSAIIGSVEIVDCVLNHESIWAEKSETCLVGNIQYRTDEAIWNWVLANPVLFAKPIENVKGRLSFWDYPLFEESYLNLMKTGNQLNHPEFKPGYSYAAHHIPSNENWYILGIDIKGNRVCAAGWPPSIGNLSDCVDFEELKPLIPEEISYRTKEFGTNWI